MQQLIDTLSRVFGKGRTVRHLFNLWPMYRSTGGRLMEVSDDLHYIKIKLPLNLRTKNYVGTHYGGHMYSCVDGLYMVQLINILGAEYVVWDKAATIRFRRPGDRTLFAEFIISPEFVRLIKDEVAASGEKDFTLKVDLVDTDGTVYAEVEKLIYVAGKEFYREKRRLKKAARKDRQ